ncbi:MAG: LemA family protein [Muribaculaceae bacterium]|nr:LemA family protein [Muribaculaceae bacterium]
MKKGTIALIVIGVLVVIAFFAGKSTYNTLVTQEQEVDQAWSKVEVQYQRRMDLIPNMVETVKGYAAHEQNTYENVTRARAGLSEAYESARSLEGSASPADAQAFDAYNAAQQSLNRALSIYVNAVREAYPDLKADTQFSNLQTVLEGTENRIATERGRYTEVVKGYNIAVKRFPANIWASIFGFNTKPQFRADEAASSAPNVSF